MLRACVLEFKGIWVQYLPLIEFAYNNSYQATIGMLPYEALYGQKCQSPLYWDNVGERQTLGLKLIQDTHACHQGTHECSSELTEELC
jgi:hypothetical protein